MGHRKHGVLPLAGGREVFGPVLETFSNFVVYSGSRDEGGSLEDASEGTLYCDTTLICNYFV